MGDAIEILKGARRGRDGFVDPVAVRRAIATLEASPPAVARTRREELERAAAVLNMVVDSPDWLYYVDEAELREEEAGG